MDFRGFRLQMPDFKLELSGNVSLQVVLRLILNRFDTCLKSDRRNGIKSRSDLPHHRAYRPVHGGSLI